MDIVRGQTLNWLARLGSGDVSVWLCTFPAIPSCFLHLASHSRTTFCPWSYISLHLSPPGKNTGHNQHQSIICDTSTIQYHPHKPRQLYTQSPRLVVLSAPHQPVHVFSYRNALSTFNLPRHRDRERPVTRKQQSRHTVPPTQSNKSRPVAFLVPCLAVVAHCSLQRIALHPYTRAGQSFALPCVSPEFNTSSDARQPPVRFRSPRDNNSYRSRPPLIH